MALTGNIGEWSEIYTLFKLLGEGRLYAGNAKTEKLNIYYPILNIIREEAKKYEYMPNEDKNIVIINEDGVEFGRVSMNMFIEESKALFDGIKASKERAFEMPDTEKFMTEIGCTKLKAPSKDKSDIHIVIHDLRTNMKPLLGFSIKSQLGSASTLLNAGFPTNFLFVLTNLDLSDEDINQINLLDSIRKQIAKVNELGGEFVFSDLKHKTFKNNLLFIDSNLPQLIAQCLLIHNGKGISQLKDVSKELAKANMFNFSGSNLETYYSHKIKSLLIDSALGMTPATEWNGRYDANGGYIVVRKDGEIVCYHFYNRNDVEDYLFNNTRFENASRSRYDFGKLFRGEDGKVYMNLNLQIRFMK